MGGARRPRPNHRLSRLAGKPGDPRRRDPGLRRVLRAFGAPDRDRGGTGTLARVLVTLVKRGCPDRDPVGFFIAAIAIQQCLNRSYKSYSKISCCIAA